MHSVHTRKPLLDLQAFTQQYAAMYGWTPTISDHIGQLPAIACHCRAICEAFLSTGTMGPGLLGHGLLGHWALGLWAPGLWALGPGLWALWPWALNPWALGPEPWAPGALGTVALGSGPWGLRSLGPCSRARAKRTCAKIAFVQAEGPEVSVARSTCKPLLDLQAFIQQYKSILAAAP